MFTSKIIDSNGKEFSVSIYNDDVDQMESFKSAVQSGNVKEFLDTGTMAGEFLPLDNKVSLVDFLTLDSERCSHIIKEIVVGEDDVIFKCEVLNSTNGSHLTEFLNRMENSIYFQPRCLRYPNSDDIIFITIDVGMKPVTNIK